MNVITLNSGLDAFDSLEGVRGDARCCNVGGWNSSSLLAGFELRLQVRCLLLSTRELLTDILQAVVLVFKLLGERLVLGQQFGLREFLRVVATNEDRHKRERWDGNNASKCH